MTLTRRLFGLAAVVMLLAAACTGGGATTAPTLAPGTDTPATDAPATDGPATDGPAELTPVRLQLQWVTQSQFAGYFAAVDQGFYEDEGLEVEILQGAVEIVPQSVVAAGDAEFGLAWLPKVLASIEQGAAGPSGSWSRDDLQRSLRGERCRLLTGRVTRGASVGEADDRCERQ